MNFKRVIHRVFFLRRISNNLSTFLRLLSASVQCSLVVRRPSRKKYFLENDFASKYTLKLFGEKVEVYLRKQDTMILFEVFQDEAYKDSNILGTKNTLDLGAHIGLVSLYFYLKYNPTGVLFMVEPSLENLKLLESNTKIIPPQKKIIINAAVSDENGYCDFNTENLFGYNHCIKKTNDSESLIKMYTIDSLINEYNINDISILKMDVEGIEKSIIQKEHDRWPTMTKIFLCEFHGNTDELNMFLGQIRKKDFTKILTRDNIIVAYKE